MNINTTYGSIQTPSENTDITGNPNSPAGQNSSLNGYSNVESVLIGGATTYISPSSTAQAINSSQNVKQEALRVWNMSKTNYTPSSWYGPNL